MRFFHIGDLHLGKKIYDFSMIDDQKYILSQILEKAEEENIDGIFISGDVYDKGVPPVEAVRLLDEFLTELSKRNIAIFMIAGNHDSAYRLDFGSRLFHENKIHICGSFGGALNPIVIEDEFGEIGVYLLPFIKPAVVSPFFQEDIATYQKAVELVLQETNLDKNRRNVLLAHQFVTWRGEAEQSDSETYSLGGIDEVDASIFFDFDYVALGHLHSPQKIGKNEIRFAGSPLAYSFSEIRRKKTITKVELREKGNIQIDFIPLIPKRPLREIKGPLEGLLAAARAEDGSEDYIRGILTDTMLLNDPVGQLRTVYPNLMTLEVEAQGKYEEKQLPYSAEEMTPQELFELFFERQNQKEMDDSQKQVAKKAWEELGDDME
ncbi:exonuclease SbcCD subunit D [Anaerotignum sp. MB30-C6]|uniref:exonuclease SbcCD subunit D n=1 Tax=Anaerotignum sp. MB30-C6 TaxID=3070814 RepID=UPI0027DD8510|nr:exonuclease SbcCD subunit D [Anaerotignum sp. MB30-C6]WMI80099.1 exonuclease SbcCD subunit D [Anaerotignum sp. MB30-C6]